MPAPFSGSAKQSGFVKLEGGKGDDQLHQVVTKTKKCDPLKQGLEELQRILPHLGSPEEEKVIYVMFDRDCPSCKNCIIISYSKFSLILYFLLLDKSSKCFI